MSADGIGIIGAAALAISATPVLIAGASIVGAVYGAARLIEYTSDSKQISAGIQKEQERKRAAELARKSEEERQKIEEVTSALHAVHARQSDARIALNQNFAAKLSLVADELEKNRQAIGHGAVELVKSFEQRSSELLADWQRSSEQLQSSYSDSVQASIADMKRVIKQGQDVVDSIQSLAEGDSRKEQYAMDQIEKAKIVIASIETEIGVAENVLVSNLNKAIDYYNQSMFDNAYFVASAVVMDGYDYLASALIQREKAFSLLDVLESKSILQKARIASIRHFTFEYKGESYEEDLTRFSSGIFAAISDRINALERSFSSPDPASLISASHDLDEIGADLDEMIKLSAAKLLYAYTENDIAADITSAMKQQGFDMEGYAYEGDAEGNSLHINYFNRVSNERVTVVLTPSAEGIKAEVHNYGANSADGQEDAVRQDSIRKLIEDTLNVPISCTNRGRASINIHAADLEEVKRLRQN